MKPWIFAACLAFALGRATAQEGAWQPSPEHAQTPIWPGAVPDAQPAPGPEGMKPVEDQPVAGRPWMEIGNVSEPTMTVYSPDGKNTGAAVVVFPGGGYKNLAIDLEGTEVADWLTSRGITCVLLKYRVPFSGPHVDEEHDRMVYPDVPRALQDAQRCVGSPMLFFFATYFLETSAYVGLSFGAGSESQSCDTKISSACCSSRIPISLSFGRLSSERLGGESVKSRT